MHLIHPVDHSRRAFLRRSSQLALAGTALPLALNLAAFGEAAAAGATDYKALVCVFLNGGNDYANTVVAYDDPSYNAYSTIRGGTGGDGIALAKGSLSNTYLDAAGLPAGRQYALHPALAPLSSIYNMDAKVAVQLNVGPLIEPITRTQYNTQSKRSPPKLMSHNDQASMWQSSAPEGSTVGWGGGIGDRALSQNSNALFTCMSVTGNTVFLSGANALQYQVSTSGAIPINGVVESFGVYGSMGVRSALTELVQQTRSHLLENEYNRVTKRSMGAQTAINGAISSDYPNAMGTLGERGNPLARQLAMVARLIRGHDSLGAKRQVFMVSIGGFDLHDNLLVNHQIGLKYVGDAMAAFYNEMKVLGLSENVTAFTASEFGRTLATNSRGADHGWGGHQFVVGGAVKGKKFYGTAPVITVTDTPSEPGYESHIGQGRLIPSTAVDQYAGTLAKWFGVGSSDLSAILPNLGNFSSADMGFMNPA